MNHSLRTFIAVKIAPEEKLLRVLKDFKESLREERIKWVDKNNLHLTLKFLGDTSVKQVEEIKQILEQVLQTFQYFEMDVKGVGFFKNKREPKVLFARIEDAEQLKSLA